MNRYAAGGVVRRGKGRYGPMPPPGGGMNPAMGGMSALGEAAMSTAFALMMLDFSSMEGAIMSIVMLGTALPSVIASFKQLPLLMDGLAAKAVSMQAGGFMAQMGGGMLSGVMGASPLSKMGGGAGLTTVFA